MNTNSNTYTFVYAALLVIIVAAGLAYVAGSLKERQQSNIDTEKRLNILNSAHLAMDANKVSNKNDYVAAQFEQYITRAYLVNNRGEVIEGDAFATELKHQSELLPLFECTLDDGTLLYIVPCYGQGLWGPIWGYLAFKDDCNTIYGAVIDHQGETPGLGAEISTEKYTRQFIGKTIFENEKFVSIAVVKGGAKPGDKHAVDAVSGGTITSNALQNLLFASLEAYVPFFNLKSKQ